jgi:hypothetical protein
MFAFVCLVVSSEPGTLYFLIDGSNRSDISIPIFEILASSYEPIQAAIQNGTEVRLIALTNEPNEWVFFYTGPAGIIFAVVFVSISAALAIFAAVKIILLLINGMKFVSVPVISLFLELIASVCTCDKTKLQHSLRNKYEMKNIDLFFDQNFFFFEQCIVRCFVTVDVIGAFRFFPWGAHTVISVTGIPLTMSVTILIAFYWYLTKFENV